jgi:fatty-acyl-CoA synthase
MTRPPELAVPAWMDRRAARTPERPAIFFCGRTWTYRQVAVESGRYRALLRRLGIDNGDRVVTVAANSPSFFFLLVATGSLGAVLVPLNYRLTAAELHYIIEDVDPAAIFTDRAHAAVVRDATGNARRRRLVSLDEDLGASPTNATEHPSRDAGDISTTAAGIRDIAVIMYTSGTSGRPKGAMLTHANLWWSANSMIQAVGITAADIALVVSPLFHIGGVVTLSLPTLYQGGLVVLHQAFDAEKVLTDIERFDVTVASLVPTTLRAVSLHPAFRDTDLTSLRFVISGGEAPQAEVIDEWCRRGTDIVTGYGMTETTGSLTVCPPTIPYSRPGSAGLTHLTSEAVVADSLSGAPCRLGDVGEIQAKGPTVTPGYWRDPEATARAFTAEGFFRTGDLGFIDPDDGLLYVVGRLNDMIITGGENVYPAEVEGVLSLHHAVQEVAVIGVPDVRWGQRVVAVVVPRAGATLTLEDLRAWGSRRLARYKLPAELRLKPVLPRNAAGKVVKMELLK